MSMQHSVTHMHGPVPAPSSAGAKAALATAEAAGLTAAAAPWDGSDDDEDDVVVREIDVYMCNDFNSSGTQLALLQHPLRPPWRPYEYHKVKSVRVKPLGKRLEVNVPLETRSINYNPSAEEHIKIKEICLKSSLSEARTSYCVGSIKDGKLLLAPLNYTLQMRPTLPHLNDHEPKGNGSSANGRGADGDSDDGAMDADEPETKPVLQAVEVQVQKRETERQQQARLNSYAYISSKEDEEAWQTLELHTAEKMAAARTWEKFMVAKDNDVVKAMGGALDRPAYLRSIIPPTAAPAAQHLSALEELAALSLAANPAAPRSGSAAPAVATGPANGVVKAEGGKGKGAAASTAAKSAAGTSAAAAAAGSSSAARAPPSSTASVSAEPPQPPQQQHLPEASARCIPTMLRNILRQHGVMTLGSLRKWLGSVSSSGAGAAAAAVANAQAVAAREASALSDKALIEVLLTRGRLVCIRRVYLLSTLDDEKLDGFRSLLLQLVREKECFKKGELLELAAAKGVQVCVCVA